MDYIYILLKRRDFGNPRLYFCWDLLTFALNAWRTSFLHGLVCHGRSHKKKTKGKIKERLSKEKWRFDKNHVGFLSPLFINDMRTFGPRSMHKDFMAFWCASFGREFSKGSKGNQRKG
ncbi:hypothetical protein Dimus_037970 [Dionaea muscipula]